MKAIIPGDRFKLTGQFLRSTGQFAGGEGQSVWTAQACDCGLCKSGGFVASDEERYDGEGQRHFAIANVYKVGTLDVRNA